MKNKLVKVLFSMSIKFTSSNCGTSSRKAAWLKYCNSSRRMDHNFGRLFAATDWLLIEIVVNYIFHRQLYPVSKRVDKKPQQLNIIGNIGNGLVLMPSFLFRFVGQTTFLKSQTCWNLAESMSWNLLLQTAQSLNCARLQFGHWHWLSQCHRISRG